VTEEFFVEEKKRRMCFLPLLDEKTHGGLVMKKRRKGKDVFLLFLDEKHT